MSIIFGKKVLPDAIVDEHTLSRLGLATRRWALDGTFVRAEGPVGMGFQPLHTHQRSKLEARPGIDGQGNMVTLDGRLDNYEELKKLLPAVENNASESEIVLAAFRKWGDDCFSHLIGDWALALWSEKEGLLYLARDHAGTRTLHFEERRGHVIWSTYLETFFAEGRSREIDEAYSACYLAGQPGRDMTPYKGIYSVTPAHYLVFRAHTIERRPHWECYKRDQIVYRTDGEYEEHFRSLLEQSVQRRTVSGAPILAHLSGGMDSTAIVCISDRLRKNAGAPDADLLETISYYDRSEPDWNEEPYFSIVESARGKVGAHVPISFGDRTLEACGEEEQTYHFPGADTATIERERRVEEAIAGRGYRAVLSGIGGDELLGGVPTPLPELADHLISANLSTLVRRAVAWSLPSRTPLVHSLWSTCKYVANAYRRPRLNRKAMPPWTLSSVYSLCSLNQQEAQLGPAGRIGLTPNQIHNGRLWGAMLETLPSRNPALLARYEYRYPFLDRDLVDYLYRIPAIQLRQPGYRRSLMRRALIEIVPSEILNRKRKARLTRGVPALLRDRRASIERILEDLSPFVASFVHQKLLRQMFQQMLAGDHPEWGPSLIRLLSFELWCRAQSNRKLASTT